MQIQIINPEYAKVIQKECIECDRLIAKMLEFNHLMERIEHNAVNNANVVYENVGTLNVTKSQAKALQKMTNKRVQQLREAEIKEIVDAENMFVINK